MVIRDWAEAAQKQLRGMPLLFWREGRCTAFFSGHDFVLNSGHECPEAASFGLSLLHFSPRLEDFPLCLVYLSPRLSARLFGTHTQNIPKGLPILGKD